MIGRGLGFSFGPRDQLRRRLLEFRFHAGDQGCSLPWEELVPKISKAAWQRL